jgi:hypothetical protein
MDQSSTAGRVPRSQDNKFLELAVNGHDDLILTGDNNLLVLDYCKPTERGPFSQELASLWMLTRTFRVAFFLQTVRKLHAVTATSITRVRHPLMRNDDCLEGRLGGQKIATRSTTFDFSHTLLD